jgi:hypothetical protein
MMRALLMAWLVATLVCGCGPSSDGLAGQDGDAVPGAGTTRIADTRRIHAVIVGIDHYRYSDARQPGAVFSDLRGAVGDAQRFKQALAEIYGVDVDVSDSGSCDSSNVSTTTLTDGCATRARILAALEQRIATLRPGDTLFFYFAGHGSRYRDDEARDQDTGYNGTILPTDARNPDGAPGDIFDVELKGLKDRAVAAGLYFASVFDSCNSATATRDGAVGLSRSAPALTDARRPAPVATPRGAGGGYWVHLAAAQDGEEAQETDSGRIGTRAGVFTSALLDTLRMPGMRDATFGDMIHEVRMRVAMRGHAAQTPSAEGALTAAVGARSRALVLYDVVRVAGGATLQAGATGGITRGSRFALYSSQADAVARRARVATASVSKVGGISATLAFDAAPGDTLPTRLVAEEIAHFLPSEELSVAIDLPAGPTRDTVAAALLKTKFTVASATAPTHLVQAEGDGGAVAVRAEDGEVLVESLGRVDDQAFPDRLADALRKIARVQQLLALRTSGSTDPAADPFRVSACIAADGYRPTACPPLQVGGVRRIGMGDRITVTVMNRGARPAYVYVLAIDPYNAVDLVLPKPGEFDRPQPPNQPYRRSGMAFDAPGTYRFVVLASAQPIRADAFQQSGTGTRDLAACTSPLERLLCASSEGQRDASVVAVGDWSAQVSTVLATREEPDS